MSASLGAFVDVMQLKEACIDKVALSQMVLCSRLSLKKISIDIP